MKRVNTIAAFILAALLLMNVFSFLNINRRFISFLSTSIEKQVNLCGTYMEGELEEFESDLNRLLFDYQFSSIFNDIEELERSKQSMQVFYSKYRDLITNVFIFDNNKNYFGLYINDRDIFVIDTFPRQRQMPLSPRDKVERKGSTYLYHYPYFDNDQVSGNIIVEVDFNSFAEKIFSFYPLGRTVSWQWILNSEGEILSNTFPEKIEVDLLSVIADSIDMFSSGSIDHRFIFSDGNPSKVRSAYFPLSIFNQGLGIVFTASQSNFNRFFIYQNLLVSILAFCIALSLIIYLLLIIGKRTRSQETLKMSEIVFRQIIEKFPVGILILDGDDIIRNINYAAQQMMFVGKKDKLIGQDFKKQFLVSNKYLLADSIDSVDSSDYLYYEKDGIETVIFRIEQSTRIGGEQLKLIALIDVSSIERSRKREVAANKAKSDFLASMSHEIRTPMNGILGMVESLLNSKLPESTSEKVKIIKKSSDLLMTIINDILDFSKIEAGKMMLEEIPFIMREEVSLVMELFRPLAEEKGLKIDFEIATSVPDKLIGDPFRLRQVISNLVSNAIKFTEKGRILLGAELTENYKGKMQLLFWVEDTGIGIPQDKISSIFGSYSQSQGSVSRKFGGTGLGTAISKQLVELMNGEIWVESPSRISTSDDLPGSRFSFTIEVYSNEKIQKALKLDGISQLNQITVLFLTKEPNPEKNSINKLLHQFGVNIVTKIYQDSTIDTVIHHLNTKKELYQLLIIADKNNLEGFALANRLKEEGLMSYFPSIMVCNNDQAGNYKISKKLEIDYYIIDPFESKEVFDILNEIFTGLKDQGSVKSMLNALPGELSILLVEDNLINQKVGQSIFKNIGYEIEIASNGIEALEMVDKNKYDIIFMDLFMPELDGFEATEQIRKKGIKTPIIAMSADPDDKRKADAILAGMDDFIEKPAKLEIIKQLLMKLFSSKLK
jgi:signal transduction histidine kinase/CheY-like chemotaxis protein